MFLIPGSVHYITWQKQNLLDTATYYPQVVIKDKKTNAVLLAATDLESLGSDRYGVSWKVPLDPNGNGKEIAQIITVYEDAAHTVVSGMYGAWETDFLIYELKPLGGYGGGGGGTVIDWNKIREIVKEEVAKIPKTEIDFRELLEEIGEVKTGIKEKIRQVFNLEKKTENLSKLEKELEKTIKGVDDRSLKSEIRINNAIDIFNKIIDEIQGKIKYASEEEIKNLKQEVSNGAKTIIKVFNEEKIKIQDDLKEKIFRKMVVSFDEPTNNTKDNRASNLLKYVS